VWRRPAKPDFSTTAAAVARDGTEGEVVLNRQQAISDVTNTLATLIAATARRDQAAFAELYNLTKAKLFGIALALTRRRELAEDVLQEAYMRVWRHAASYDAARAAPITWMATIVHNLAIDVLRSQRTQPTGGDDELAALPAESVDVLGEIQLSGDRQRAYAALKSLDPVKRRLIVAAYVRGESRAELARRFGVPVGTIKSWLRRATLEVRASVAAEAGRRDAA
jgi:RNA polymerase sigma-70 factor, ECF subfamily